MAPIIQDREDEHDDAMSDHDDPSSEDEPESEQVRVSFHLASDFSSDASASLQVPSEPMAVPASTTRKGLSAVLNLLLDRSDDDDDDETNNKALNFEFLVGPNQQNNKLLRAGVGIEKEARRLGLSLEDAIRITYFPADTAPSEPTSLTKPLPDWISCLSFVPTVTESDKSGSGGLLVSATYAGGLHVFYPRKDDEIRLESLAVQPSAHAGPIKCLDVLSASDATGNNNVWMATGSMDHTLSLHRLFEEDYRWHLETDARCVGGHSACIGSVDLRPGESGNGLLLASGDWDGGVCLWNIDTSVDKETMDEQATKRTKTSKAARKSQQRPTRELAPMASIQAHSSKVSGLSFGNKAKHAIAGGSGPCQLISGSWDHSLKVWDVEQQDCLLTLNGSRVVSCLDTSYHSEGIVATGHPDCRVRLWDVRTGNPSSKEDGATVVVSDNTFRPRHKAWISSVQWSRRNPYHVASTSHDGTIQLWDIRSSLPLYSVRAFENEDKALCLAMGEAEDATGVVWAGGTDCIVKQFESEH